MRRKKARCCGPSCGRKNQLYAIKIAIKASKNIKTPPTMGKIIGAAWATASIASGIAGAAFPSVAVLWASCPWGFECAAFDMWFPKIDWRDFTLVE
jgi:hypothetical protein